MGLDAKQKALEQTDQGEGCRNAQRNRLMASAVAPSVRNSTTTEPSRTIITRRAARV